MKNSILLFICVSFFLGCKKDNDGATTNPTPSPTTCRIKSADKAGKNQFDVSYDTKGRISKWVEFSGDGSRYNTYTFQYQEGSNKVFIGSPGSSELYAAEVNGSGNITKITVPSTGANPGVTTIDYNSAGNISKILSNGGKQILEFTYTNGDLTRVKNSGDTSKPGESPVWLDYYTVDYEYSDNTIYKLVPPDLIRPRSGYSSGFMPFVVGNQQNRKIPSKATVTTLQPPLDVDTDAFDVQIKDGTLPKTVNSVTYTYENCQ